MTLVFADVETTGLRPDMGAEIWEIALIVRRDIEIIHFDRDSEPGTEDTEYAWQVRPDLRLADPAALKVSGYYQRCRVRDDPAGTAQDLTSPMVDRCTAAQVAGLAAGVLDGALIVGANPWFDSGHLDAFLRGHGQCLAADYHMRDLGSLVTGFIAGQRRAVQVMARAAADTGQPLRAGWDAFLAAWPVTPKLTDMARAAGIDPRAYPAHTALGDARLARDIWDAVMAT